MRGIHEHLFATKPGVHPVSLEMEGRFPVTVPVRTRTGMAALVVFSNDAWGRLQVNQVLIPTAGGFAALLPPLRGGLGNIPLAMVA